MHIGSFMKNNHAIAFGCFVVASIFYFASDGSDYAVGFAVVGGFFELAAWMNLFKRKPKPDTDQR